MDFRRCAARALCVVGAKIAQTYTRDFKRGFYQFAKGSVNPNLTTLADLLRDRDEVDRKLLLARVYSISDDIIKNKHGRGFFVAIDLPFLKILRSYLKERNFKIIKINPLKIY